MTSFYIPSPSFPIKPRIIDLAEHTGKSLALARANHDHARVTLLERIYNNLTPEARGRADIFASWFLIEGGKEI